MSEKIAKFTNKVSPLIEGQVPDFIQADHPIFVDFVKDYFKFLEAGRLTLTNVVNYVSLETNTVNFILDEEGERVVTEIGEGTTGLFVVGETITGETSKATATVLVDDSRNAYLYVSGQQLFQTGETITGSTSGSTGTIDEYRGNPIQNIQQMLEYANVDNTLYDFLDQMRDQFMVSIPDNLVSSLDKRRLIKNIKDLYAAKGTSEGHKLFMRMLLGENAEVFYPTEHMLRPSAGKWENKTIIRVVANSGVEGEEVVNQLITGGTSGATAIVVSSVVSQQTSTVGSATFNDAVTELEIANIDGTFTDGETLTALSTTRDINVNFTLFGIVADASVVNGGILYSNLEQLEMEAIGNNFAQILVDGIKTGSVSEVIVDDVGSGYEAGDVLTFSPASADTDVETATGFVSVVGGGIQLESGTLDDSTITDDILILEDAGATSLVSFDFQLETTLTDYFQGDADTTAFTLVNTNADNDTLTVYVDNVLTPTVNVLTNGTVWSASGSTLTFVEAPSNNAYIVVQAGIDHILLDRTDTVGGVSGSGTTAVGGSDSGYRIKSDTVTEELDTYTTDSDQIVLEYDTLTTSQASSIRKVYMSRIGSGYSTLPTVGVTTTGGSSAKLLATTTDIGAANNLKVNNTGFRYSSTNAPDATMRAHFIVKDVTGTFAADNTLTTHTGTVKSWDATNNVLETTFENVIRLVQEQDGTFNEGIQLESATEILDPQGVLLEDEQDFDVDGDSIILNGSGTFTPSPKTDSFIVRKVSNDAGTQNYFSLNGGQNPILTLYEGNTYFFDLSHSSLYNDATTANHQLKFSETSGGTHGGGTAYTTGVTTSAASIAIGTAGAYIQIVVASGSPTLYYYCTNHSGMGNIAYTPSYPTTILDAGSNLVLNGTDRFDFNFLVRKETSAVALTDKLQLEDNDSGGAKSFLINEETLPDELAQNIANLNSGGKILLDRFHENESVGSEFIILDGTDASSSDAGSRLANEDFGNTLILDGTDASSSDARDGFLLDDETGDGNVVLNGSDSASVDAGDDIINESAIDFSNRNVTITDSGGATATIVTSNIGTALTSVGTVSTDVGRYRGINNIIGEDLIRIQDSYYYQDYSYEIQIGQSLSTYINDLKKAVHPAGFQPFGKVTIATLVSAAVTNTAAGVSGYEGDTKTFSPILGSVLETIFSQVLKSRLQVPSTTTHDGQVSLGSRDDKIVQENGVLPGDNLVLNGTDGSSTNAGENIILEDENLLSEDNNIFIVLNGTDDLGSNAGDNIRVNSNTGFDLELGLTTHGESFLYEEKGTTADSDETRGTGDGGGRIMAETSHAPSGNSDKSLVTEKVIKINSQPDALNPRNILLYLAETPFGTTNGTCGITLESGSGNLTDSLVLDGTLPFDEGNAFLELERDSEIDNIILDGTDALGSNAGEGLILETGFFLKIEDPSLGREGETFNILAEDFFGDQAKMQLEADLWSFPIGYVVNENDRLLFDSNHNDETISLSDISSFSFEDIRRRERISLSGSNDVETHWGGTTDEDDIVLENFGQLLLDGTDSSGTDDGFKVAQETTKRNYFTLELSGNLIVEDTSTTSHSSKMIIEGTANDNIIFEDVLQKIISPNIQLETDVEDGDIILNGTDSSGNNAGHNIILELFHRIEPNDAVVFEDHSVIASEGHIPVVNYTLNSTNVITKGHVRSSEISVRDTGDIALEDATDDTHGYLVINSTSGSSTNAGENIDLEGATGITY